MLLPVLLLVLLPVLLPVLPVLVLVPLPPLDPVACNPAPVLVAATPLGPELALLFDCNACRIGDGTTVAASIC